MDQRPEEEKAICSICGASFLARTAAETGGYCKRHVFSEVPERVWTEDDDLFFAISPSGEFISSTKNLPLLPFPKEIFVGSDCLRLDGWTIRTVPLSGSFMEWLNHRLFHWRCSNVAPADQDQLRGLVDALERQFLNTPKKSGDGFPSGRGNF